MVVEWLNESVGSDTAPDWIGDHTELIRDGFAWVGVSAQALGVNGGTGVLPGSAGRGSGRRTRRATGPCTTPVTPTPTTSSRRRPRPSATPGGVVAARWAQSRRRSSPTANRSPPSSSPPTSTPWPRGPTSSTATCVHSRWGGGTSLSGPLDLGVHEPFRTDLAVPVLAFETETDLIGGVRQRPPTRQPVVPGLGGGGDAPRR